MKKIDQGQAYLIYLMLHHLEVAGLFEDETCDQRWDIAKQHIVEFEESEWDDENKSHYECFEEYAESFVKYWFKGKERNMTKLEKLEATVKELAETVKHTVDEQSALCMRVNLLEEGGRIESPPINGKLVRLVTTDRGYGVDILDAESYAVLEAFHHDKMMDAMLDYQTQLGVIRNTTNGINNSSDLAIAVANDEVAYPPKPETIHFQSSCGEMYVNLDGTVNTELSEPDCHCPDNDPPSWLNSITKVDLEEWRHYLQLNDIDADCGDILEVGYWDKDGIYYKPDYQWREDSFHNVNFTPDQLKKAIDKSIKWGEKNRPVQNDETLTPEPKRFKIYGDEYPEIWAHFKGKDYNPKFEEELVVQFHNHRESRDH